MPTGSTTQPRSAVGGTPTWRRRRLARPLLLALVALGILLRLWVSTFGFNLDVASYSRVVAISEQGGNVYADTSSYNYGPVWFHVLRGLARLSLLTDEPHGVFRFLLACFLTLVDLGIFTVLRRRGGDGVAVLFLLNPVSIIITGYHRQFGNLALLLGLVAAGFFDRSDPDRLDPASWLGMAALGVSLATKHLLFAYSWWLAVKKRRLHHKLIVLLVPPLLFLAGFFPYWADGSEGIINNVFLYRSLENQPLWAWLMPPLAAAVAPAWIGLLAGLALGGLLFRRCNAFVSLLFYTVFLLVLSPAVANQYLALVMPFAAWFINPFTVLYTLTAGTMLAAAPDGLELAPYLVIDWMYGVGYALLLALLIGALAWIFWRDRIITSVERSGSWLREEIKTLLGTRR
jgi:hypothetical protein